MTTAPVDPFIQHVLTLRGDLADDVARDLQDGWDFNPERMPGTVALFLRLRQMNAIDGAMAAYWSALTSYTQERPHEAEEVMSLMEYGPNIYLSIEGGPRDIRSLVAELETDGDWVSVP